MTNNQEKQSSIKTIVKDFEQLTTDELLQWSLLADNNVNSAPWIGPNWIGAWIKSTGTNSKIALMSNSDNETLIAVIPFTISRKSIGARKIKVASATVDNITIQYDFSISKFSDSDPSPIWNEFLKLNQFDIVSIDRIREDSPSALSGIKHAEINNLKSVSQKQHKSPYRVLPTELETWEYGLKPKFKSNLRNRQKRIAEIGQITFETVTGKEKLQDAFRIFCELESKGWKKDAGGALESSDKTISLYKQFIENSHESISFEFMKLDNIPIAAHFLCSHNKRLFLVKITYDEKYSKYSPGQLLTTKVMEDAVEKKYEVFDFLGREMVWKRDWTETSYQYIKLMIFKNSSAANYAYWVRFGLRETLKKNSFLVKMFRKIKN